MTAYCHRQGTDGFVPAAKAEQYADADIIAAMLAHGLLARFDGGYTVADYLTYQESAEERLAAQLAYATNQSAAGKKGGATRARIGAKDSKGRFTKGAGQSTRIHTESTPNTDTERVRSTLEVEVVRSGARATAPALTPPPPPSAVEQLWAIDTRWSQVSGQDSRFDALEQALMDQYPGWCLFCGTRKHPEMRSTGLEEVCECDDYTAGKPPITLESALQNLASASDLPSAARKQVSESLP
jgi:hypothetical protein